MHQPQLGHPETEIIRKLDTFTNSHEGGGSW